LGVQADVKLYPPEIDVRVSRLAQSEGVPRPADVHLVRTGGAATTRDDWIRVSTHWRVRKSSGSGSSDGGTSGPPAPPRDAGVCRADSGPCPSAIGDEGDAGERLEVYCSELPPNARDDKCLTDDSVLTDVPAGVPALAGHLVRVTGAAAEGAVVG